jgi:Holliday junction resolvasome RuvABC endonuclease subunit
MNEAETRAEHIDPALKAAGWGVVDGSRIRREYHITLGRLEGQGRRAKLSRRSPISMTYWHTSHMPRRCKRASTAPPVHE